MFTVTVTVTSFKNIVAYRRSALKFKPSLGNSNVHRRINLGIEPSASKILRDNDSAYCFIYVSRSHACRCFLSSLGDSSVDKTVLQTTPYIQTSSR